jgi:cytoskeletal protein RodZ
LSFGAYLRQSRALRELSLEDVATATRLPARIVAALEADDFTPLQDRAHALLVARSCAAAIGLDPEETALRLEEQLQRLDPAAAERAPLWKRLWEARPREPLVWIIVCVTAFACAALLFKRH